MSTDTTGPALRRGHGSTYVPTSPQIGVNRHVFSCLRCGHERALKGRKKHRLYGFICATCVLGCTPRHAASSAPSIDAVCAVPNGTGT